MEKRLDLYFEWDNDVMQLSDWLVPLFKNNGDVLAFRNNVSIQEWYMKAHQNGRDHSYFIRFLLINLICAYFLLYVIVKLVNW